MAVMQDFKTLALYGARVAGTILEKHFQAANETAEGHGALEEQRAETVLVKAIQKGFPDHEIWAKNHGWPIDSISPFRWMIDPLCGAHNYSRGLPGFCLSIALQAEGEIILGLVYDPLQREMFLAERGKGSWLNGARLHVSGATELRHAMLASGPAYDARHQEKDFLAFAHLAQNAQGVRRTGVPALDLCNVAAGRFEGFWDCRATPWTTAAASLIVTEAGGRVTDFEGGPYLLAGTDILASNGHLHLALQTLLEGSDERRACRRIPVKMLITYEAPRAIRTHYIHDLSGGGLFIHTSRPLPIGTGLKMSLVFPSAEREIQAEGVVVWARTTSSREGEELGMGVQFSDIDPEDREFLDQLVTIDDQPQVEA